MSHRTLIGNLFTGLAGEGLGETIGAFCTACSKGDKVAIASILAGLTGGPLLAIGLLVGGIGLQVWGQTKEAEKQRKQYEELAGSIASCKDDTQQLINLVAPIADRSEFVQARLPGYEKAELAQWVAKEVKKTLAPLLPDDAKPIDWDVLRIYIESNKAILDNLLALQREQMAISKKNLAVSVETRQEVYDIKSGQQAANQMLAKALKRLDRLGSLPRAIAPGDHAPPGPQPLSPEDRAILDAAKPFADALTKYRIAVAEGDDAVAAVLEYDVLRLRNVQRTEEDFLFERARGDRHLDAARFDEAAVAYRAALAAKADDASVLTALGFALYYARREADHGAALREADQLCDRALHLHRDKYKCDHPDVALSLTNLALVRGALGRAAGAEPLYQEALAMRQRLFEGDHRDVAESLNNLAAVRQDLGRTLEAEPLFQEALDMRRRLFDGNHPYVALSLSNLATAYWALGRPTEAEPLQEEALAMRQRLFEGVHRDVAESLNNLAVVRQALGRALEAEPLYEEALAMRRQLFDGDHPDIAESLNNLASVRLALGRATEAEPLYKEALVMHRRLFESDHASVASSLSNLAHVRLALGRAEEAEALDQQALAMRRRLFDGDHPEIARSLNNLAMDLTKQIRWRQALPWAEEAVAMGQRCLPAGHPDLQQWEANLAAIREHLDGR